MICAIFGMTVSNGMDAPTRDGIRCAKVEVRTTT